MLPRAPCIMPPAAITARGRATSLPLTTSQMSSLHAVSLSLLSASYETYALRYFWFGSSSASAVRKDPQALTMTIDAEYDASPERVWQLWADPRQLERWWGPPTYPATSTRHDLAPGSRVEYHMTGPEGDQPHGYWDIVEVDPPRSLVFPDGFANDGRLAEHRFPAYDRPGHD
jgi:hypothetical protein